MNNTHHLCPQCGTLTANVECVDMEVETLRDKFAMAALQGLIAKEGLPCDEDEAYNHVIEDRPVIAYAIADQMMVERKKDYS